MPKICYIPRSFGRETWALLEKCNYIIDEMDKQGFRLTLRGLHYQLVRRNWTVNDDVHYNRLGELLTAARNAGVVDWDAIQDRTRTLHGGGGYTDPAQAINGIAAGYIFDKWNRQSIKPECIVEKDAQFEIVAHAAYPLQVGVMAAKGYNSVSVMHETAQRIIRRLERGQETALIYLGDHDPSGLNMTDDINNRLTRYVSFHIGREININRIALNLDQVEKYKCPPNPTKPKDSRTGGYERKYGPKCWEMDAMEPRDTVELVTQAILSVRDDKLWQEAEAIEREHRRLLQENAQYWPKIQTLLSTGRIKTVRLTTSKRKPKAQASKGAK